MLLYETISDFDGVSQKPISSKLEPIYERVLNQNESRWVKYIWDFFGIFTFTTFFENRI